jgi:hypothetical protein
MARRICLHIGGPKTGTTYLQTVMWRNRPALAEQGLLYPGDRRMDHHDATLAVREASMGGRLEQTRTAWQRLTTAAAEHPGDAILSHEFYCAATAEQAARAIEHLGPEKVHLVFTVRDYVRAVPAYWQEALKMRYPDGLGAYTRAALDRTLTGPWSWLTLDAAAILQRWSSTLPPERVHVITVPAAGAPKTLLWQRYAKVLGIAPESCVTDVAVANESLGVAQAELLRRLKPRLDDDFHEGSVMYRWVREVLGHQILVPQGGPRVGLRRGEAEAFRDLSAQAAAEIREAGYHVVGDLAELVPDDLCERPHPDDLEAHELLEAALDTIAVLLSRYQRAVRRLEDINALRVSAAAAPAAGHEVRSRGVRRLAGRIRRAVGARAR